jgi:hypothetical protein
MTILLAQTNLSSRPERSGVERSAVLFICCSPDYAGGI